MDKITQKDSSSFDRLYTSNGIRRCISSCNRYVAFAICFLAVGCAVYPTTQTTTTMPERSSSNNGNEVTVRVVVDEPLK